MCYNHQVWDGCGWFPSSFLSGIRMFPLFICQSGISDRQQEPLNLAAFYIDDLYMGKWLDALILT